MTWSPRLSTSTRVPSVLFGVLIALVALVVAWPAVGSAATVTVTDCTAAPVDTRGRTTILDVGTDDLVLQCLLEPLGNTQRIIVRANNITIDGPAGGIRSSFKGRAIDVWAEGFINLTTTTIEADNSNARVRFRSGTGFEILDSILTVGGLKPGRELRIECRDAGCTMNICQSTLEAQRIRVVSEGDFMVDGAIIRARSPRDRIQLESKDGSILFCGGQVIGDVEGRLMIEACVDIDLTQAEVMTGRNILIEAGQCGTGDINLTGATVRNDIGKRGEIEIEAAGGAGQVTITDATLIDDDRSASKNDVSEINGREEVPHEGFNNTVGTPSVDS